MKYFQGFIVVSIILFVFILGYIGFFPKEPERVVTGKPVADPAGEWEMKQPSCHKKILPKGVTAVVHQFSKEGATTTVSGGEVFECGNEKERELWIY